MLHVKTLLVATLVAATLAALPSPADAATNPYRTKFGMAMGSNEDAFTLTSYAGVKDTGATWIRLALSWKDIEEVQGRRTWAQADSQIANAKAKGLKVNAVVSYTPPWAQHTGCSAHPCSPAPDRYDEYAAFVARVATRYKGKVDAIEVWNEPNETFFFKPKPNPAGYAKLLRMTSTAIRKVNTTVKIVFGGLSTHYVDDARWMTWKTFMKGFYAAGGAPYDVFAIHPYYAGGKPMRAVPENPFYNLPTTQRFLAAHGDGAKKFWLTEFGYKTGALTPKAQGERLMEALTQVTKWGFVERMFVFTWMDFRITRDNYMTAGLNDVDGRPKVSRGMLRTLVRSHDT